LSEPLILLVVVASIRTLQKQSSTQPPSIRTLQKQSSTQPPSIRTLQKQSSTQPPSIRASLYSVTIDIFCWLSSSIGRTEASEYHPKICGSDFLLNKTQ